MGNKNLKAVFMIVSAIVIILFTGSVMKMKASADESDYVIEDGVLKQYLGSDNEIVIPKGIKTIGAGAFKGCMMEKVTIPEGVQMIDEEAFQNCNKLIEIVVPDGVSELGESAFQGCSSLYRIVLCSELTVGMSAFEDCTSLKEVILPDDIYHLSYFAFKNCTSLEMIDLPESISIINSGCFENCTSLKTILFPTKEIFIGRKTFYNTFWLNNYEGDNVIINHTLLQYRGIETDITIPDNITVVGAGAFEGCSFITNMKITNGVIQIGDSAFEGCSGLKEIVLPDSVTIIGSDIFVDCTNLTKVSVPKNVNISRNCLKGTKWMMNYQGDFVILDGRLLAYQGTASKVVIPDNVTTICAQAFKNDIITEVTVPKSVTQIRNAAFILCRNLQKVYLTNKNIILEIDAFIVCSSDLKLYSFAGGLVEAYAKNYNFQFVNYGISKTDVTLYLNGDSTTSLSVSSIDGNIQWESEDTTIAKVNSNGKVTAVKTGTTKVNATINGIIFTCDITVKNPFISKCSVSITKGQTSRLNIIGISSGLAWSSSNKSVASVSSLGVITANKAGTATITATYHGKKYTCKITVK